MGRRHSMENLELMKLTPDNKINVRPDKLQYPEYPTRSMIDPINYNRSFLRFTHTVDDCVCEIGRASCRERV